METKTLNMIVIHKQSKWSKFKRRLSGWFSTNDKICSDSVIPEIIVTSPDDLDDGSQTKTNDVTPTPKTQEHDQHKKFRKAEKDDLAKAHQNVIAEMRVNLAEARGKEQPSKRHSLANVSKTDQRNNNGNQNQGVHGKPPQDQRRSVVVDLKNKPPVPPTKAAAVAKIRETIAAAKRESLQDLSSSTAPNNSENISLTDMTTVKIEQKSVNTSQNSDIEQRSKIEAHDAGDVSSNSQNRISETAISDEEKDARKAAIRAKIRNALLSAAANGSLSETNNKPSIPIKAAPLQQNNRLKNDAPGVVQSQRKNSNVSNGPPEKPRETIWEFFEQGNKKGTCKKCGYVVGCKNNKGGLTRHLSLVHQREYKLYTSKMEHNWTNGMLEKNLNMRVPSNL